MASTSLSSWTMWKVMGSMRESRKDANLSRTDPCSFSGRFARLTDLSSYRTEGRRPVEGFFLNSMSLHPRDRFADLHAPPLHEKVDGDQRFGRTVQPDSEKMLPHVTLKRDVGQPVSRPLRRNEVFSPHLFVQEEL